VRPAQRRPRASASSSAPVLGAIGGIIEVVGRALFLFALSAGCAAAEPEPAVGGLYVISALRWETSDGDVARGFDLDGIDSPGGGTSCVDRERDYVSPDGSRGIDNAMADLIPSFGPLLGCAPDDRGACVQGFFAGALADGTAMWAIEIAPTGSNEADVVVYGATLPGCSPAVSCAPELAEGSLAPGQAFALEELARGPGTLVGGHLSARLDALLELALVTPELELPLPVHGARLEADVDRDGLRGGMLGGGLEVRLVVECIHPPCPPPTALAFADLVPSASDPTACERLSTAFSFEGVPARRVEAVAR
jgi:hypothetical protein